jgi:hypothetical protein
MEILPMDLYMYGYVLNLVWICMDLYRVYGNFAKLLFIKRGFLQPVCILGGLWFRSTTI